jgi:hypothetical protein
MAPGNGKKIKNNKKITSKNDTALKERQSHPSSPLPTSCSINQFSPTHLPKNVSGPLPESLLMSFNQSLSVGTKMDFNLADDELRLKWLAFFSGAAVLFSNECTLLRAQLDQYRTSSSIDRDKMKKNEFVSHVLPRIKSGMFEIFLRLIFPSTVEVTDTRNRRVLTSFGLTHKCPLALLVFEHVFSTDPGTASEPIHLGVRDSSTDISSSTMPSANGHEFDSKVMRESLWFDHEVGSFSVKTLNSVRNTYTNFIREVVSTYILFPYMPYLLFPI